MKRLRAAWTEVKARAFPPGAITFHLGAWSRGELSEVEGVAARALLTELGFERLLVLHGSAVQVGRETVVVVGARGIGKSTACRMLVRRQEAILVEDGLVLAGEAGDRWTLIESGTLAVLRRSALVSAAMRRLLPRIGEPGPGGAVRPAGGRVARFHRSLDGIAFRGGILLSQRRRPGGVRRLLSIDRVVVAEHPDHASGSWATDGRTMSPIRDIGASVPSGTSVRRVPVSGPWSKVLHDLAEALRR